MSTSSDTPALNKPIIEAQYLNAPNVHRYRTILRFFYLQHQRLQYWMVWEDVYRHMRSSPAFADYSEEQCQQDLGTLVEWKNLMATQDAGKVQSIEEFKNRRFRYQLTPYTVEIERLTIRLASISGVGGSLEANLFERIASRLQELPTMVEEIPSRVHGWWQDLSADFQRLNDNATDYIGSLQGSQVDELLNTVAFLNYKDAIIDYLRTFIRELQRYGPVIEGHLQQPEEQLISAMVEKVAAHESTIPRVGQEYGTEELSDEVRGRWQSLQAWFLGVRGQGSEASRLLNITNGIIRKITRYAYRLAETQNRSISRHREYMHLCSLFAKFEDVKAAHELAAVVFGVSHPRHLQGGWERETDSTQTGIWEEAAFMTEIKPKVRTYRERSEVGAIRSRAEAKERARKEYLALQQREQEVLAAYIRDNQIDFSALPEIEPFVRTTLLRWVGRAMGNHQRMGTTEDGRTYQLLLEPPNRRITLACQDGSLEMPAMKLQFL